MSTNSNNSFLGAGWSFPPSFSKDTGTVAMASAEEDIRQSLIILMATRPGERPMQSNYGTNLERLLFEPMDVGLQAYVKNLIENAVLFHEPRIILDSVDLIAVQEEGMIEIHLTYTVQATNSRSNLVYPYYLNEGTNI